MYKEHKMLEKKKTQKTQTQPLPQSPRSPGVLQSCFTQVVRGSCAGLDNASQRAGRPTGLPLTGPGLGQAVGSGPLSHPDSQAIPHAGDCTACCAPNQTRAATVCPRYMPREPHPDQVWGSACYLASKWLLSGPDLIILAYYLSLDQPQSLGHRGGSINHCWKDNWDQSRWQRILRKAHPRTILLEAWGMLRRAQRK